MATRELDERDQVLLRVYDTMGIKNDSISKLEREAGVIDIDGLILGEDNEFEEIVRDIGISPIDCVKLLHFQRWSANQEEEGYIPEDLDEWIRAFTIRSLRTTPRKSCQVSPSDTSRQ